MNETVYIETSILGYLTARSTKNLILAANMEITKVWWESRRNAFILYASEAVLEEVALGDGAIATQRLDILRDYLLSLIKGNVQRNFTGKGELQGISKQIDQNLS
jgi:hypothetical protein